MTLGSGPFGASLRETLPRRLRAFAAARFRCRAGGSPRRAISTAIFSGGSTKSTQPAPMALRGMLSYFDEPSSCANVRPPASLIAFSPFVPSEPAPERITPMALAPWSAASDWRK
jgi:hypothetical protein